MAASAWQLVCGLDAWRVTQIPRRPMRLPPTGADDDGDLLMAQRAAALSAAYHGGAGPVGFAWVRDRPGGPVQVLAAGRGMAVAGGGQDAVLKIPAGGRGEPAGAGGLAQALGALPCWVRIAGVADSLLADGDLRPGPGQRASGVHGVNGIRPSLEDGLLAAWTEPFAWLVLAEPASRPELQELAFTVYAAQGSAQRFDSPQAQLRARRLQGRHASIITPRSASCGPFCLESACTLRQALQAACRDGLDGRHPRSAEWERDYGLPIPGQDCAAQLETVTRWHHDGQRDTGRLHAVAWGQRPEAALEGAIGAKAGEEDRAERVASQLSVFTAPCRWPLDYLTRPGPGHG